MSRFWPGENSIELIFFPVLENGLMIWLFHPQVSLRVYLWLLYQKTEEHMYTHTGLRCSVGRSIHSTYVVLFVCVVFVGKTRKGNSEQLRSIKKQQMCVYRMGHFVAILSPFSFSHYQHERHMRNF